MNAPFDAAGLLSAEKDASVRSVIYETAGRLRDVPEGIEGTLGAGLKDPEPAARYGPPRGWSRCFGRTAP